VQRCFWVPTTSDVDQTIATHMPDHLFERGFIALAVGIIMLVVAQKIFTHFENKIPERL
jgi:ABC-2 type transport system permease protein